MYKYVPVLRYRQEERRALTTVRFSEKTLPLIEIIKEKPNSRMNGDFVQIHSTELGNLNHPIMIDFPMYIPIGTNTQQEVTRFLRPIINNQNTRLNRYISLAGNPNFIPIVSYNPNQALTNGYLFNEANTLRQYFNRLAYRIFINQFHTALNDIRATIRANDILILDIGEDPHNNPGLLQIYNSIQQLSNSTHSSTVIIRSAIPNSITNTSLTDNQIVPADNSLLSNYNVTYHFDAFGDYAGVKRDLLTIGGSVSPGYIFYIWNNNFYVGYRGRTRVLSEFENHIVPTILASNHWNSYNSIHRTNCPGCRTITNINLRVESGNSQAKWKGIALKHYLHSMEEFL